MRKTLWVWTVPWQVERDADTIRFKGWTKYEPPRVPAMWMRIAELAPDTDTGWLTALREYGPLHDIFDEQPHDEAMLRDPWQRAIMHLSEVSFLWRKEVAAVWELPAAPIELAKGYHRLQAELARAVYEGVRLTARGLELVPEPTTLDAYLWLSAAESVREHHRFKHCERCQGWMRIQRNDARFCSAVCRNARERETA